MATCVIQRSSSVAYRKRMASEEKARRNKRTKQVSFGRDSKDNDEHDEETQFSSEWARDYSSPFSPFTPIKDISAAQTATTLSPTKHNNMLAFQQKPELSPSLDERDDSSIFLTSVQLAACLPNAPHTLLVVDCGSSLRYAERHIERSFLLNVNDKISRKRFISRGLKNFLHQDQLHRFEQSQLIVLYDDSVHCSASCANSSIVPQLSASMQCIYDEIKRYDANKTVLVLLSTFEDFFQHHPSLCHNSMVNIDDPSTMPVSLADQSVDIDSYQMSEIIPGLYLGNAHDAADLDLLQTNQIQAIVNISNSIPCHFEQNEQFKYRRLQCEDSGSQNILQHFEETFTMIDRLLNNHQRLLIHCQAGVSRSPSFVIGYLMKCHSKTFDQAYQLVKSKRTIINPNLNFLGQLTQYQRLLTSV